MRQNKYPGKCEKCGGHVARRAGGIVKRDGRWLVYHTRCHAEATDSDCEATRQLCEAQAEAEYAGSAESQGFSIDGWYNQ